MVFRDEDSWAASVLKLPALLFLFLHLLAPVLLIDLLLKFVPKTLGPVLPQSTAFLNVVTGDSEFVKEGLSLLHTFVWEWRRKGGRIEVLLKRWV